jgi:hypothetical protein
MELDDVQSLPSRSSQSGQTSDTGHEVLRQRYDKVLGHNRVTEERFLCKGQEGFIDQFINTVPQQCLIYCGQHGVTEPQRTLRLDKNKSSPISSGQPQGVLGVPVCQCLQ